MSVTTDESFYELLGVSPDASSDEIRRAHRREARRWSPDLNPSPAAHERMARINLARETLLDPAKRAAYDRDLRSDGNPSSATSGPSHRVEPDEVDLGTLAPGDSRVVEFDVYLSGREPDEIDVAPSEGEGWRLVSGSRPEDGSGRYCVLEFVVSASDETVGDHEVEAVILFDGLGVPFRFTWTVAPATAPVSPPSHVHASVPTTGGSAAPSAPASFPPATATAPHSSAAPSDPPLSWPPLASPFDTAALHREERAAQTKAALVRFGMMLLASLPVWFFTPLVASFATLVIPNITAAVFTSDENRGSTASDAPNALYLHLAFDLLLFDVAVLVVNLIFGVALRTRWPIFLGVVSGLALFLWQVTTRGGQVWQWDILPTTTFLGFVLAQVLSRSAGPTRS